VSIKDKVISALERLPNDVGFADVKEEIAVLAALDEADQDILHGRVISNEEMHERIRKWTGS